MNDFVKYLTIQFMQFIENPKEKKERINKDEIAIHWFGLIPFTLKFIAKRFKKTAQKTLPISTYPTQLSFREVDIGNFIL